MDEMDERDGTSAPTAAAPLKGWRWIQTNRLPSSDQEAREVAEVRRLIDETMQERTLSFV